MTCQSDLSCRAGCGACCIAPSITSALPGMPQGKPAGQPCAQLLPDMRCAVFGQPERPAFCGGLRPSGEMCGDSRDEALVWLTRLEAMTAPVSHPGGGRI
ncbi:MAG: YkgJ family cysteine cluster protein [Cupriavidus sp.]|nr:YkgJ family cysteine cluster protein [Cupriavidus sp.]